MHRFTPAIFHTIRIDEATLPISFACAPATLPKADAIYIQSLQEVFLSVIMKQERESILNQINLLMDHPYVFIDIPFVDIDKFFKKLAKVPGDFAGIVKKIKEIQSNETELSQFQEICQREKLQTLLVGGVFGGACVWDTSRLLGENIYSRQMGLSHPNVRFFEEELFRFKNVIIAPHISQGYNNGSAFITFQDYVHFPQQYLHQKDFGQQQEEAEDEIEEKKPGVTGRAFREFTKDNDDKMQQLVADMQKKLYPSAALYSGSSGSPRLFPVPKLVLEEHKSDTSLSEKKKITPQSFAS